MIPQGPSNPKILILIDWPDQFALAQNLPIAGSPEAALGAMLHEAGLTLGECMRAVVSSRSAPLSKGKEDFSGWLSHTKSPKIRSWKRWKESWVSLELYEDLVRTEELIRQVKPSVILGLGNLTLFALTGKVSVKKWRGSQLDYGDATFIPTYAPRYVQRDYSTRAVTVHDLRRVKRVSEQRVKLKPQFDLKVRPTFPQAKIWISAIQGELDALQSNPIPLTAEHKGGKRVLVMDRRAVQTRVCLRIFAGELRAQRASTSLEVSSRLFTGVTTADSASLPEQALRESEAPQNSLKQGERPRQDAYKNAWELAYAAGKAGDLEGLLRHWKDAEASCGCVWAALEDGAKCDIRAQAHLRLSVDIETRAGHMACIGFAWDKVHAFSIPLMCIERPTGYWTHIEEVVLVILMKEFLTHPRAQCFGQNFIYDIQYIYRFWFIIPNTWYDTMNAQHIMFPGTPKGLDYLASMYCEHYVYWKDDGKDWDPSMGEDQLWVYNCEDCVRTFEVMEAQWPAIPALGLYDVWDFQQNKLFPLLLKAMIRGVRADTSNKAVLSFKLLMEITEREGWLESVLGHPVNIKSPKQMLELFITDLKQRPVISRKTGRPTMDDDALELVAKRQPLLQGVVNKIQELRSLHVFKSTFVDAKLDGDHRLRSSYNIAGTETFRLSSSQNAFNSGMNFQNIPPGGGDPNDPYALVLPNIRELFLPDPGYTIFDMDLQSADFYTVVWEADDEEFRQALASGIDMHGLNAKSLFGLSCGAGEVKKLHNDKRQLAKIWCHATNYGAGANNMARACGITVKEAERLRERWFQMHPGIREWHKRTEGELHSHRRVSNVFGYRMVFFDRIDAALPVALAWRPQSQTGCVINRAWAQLAERMPEIEFLIQVHDSLVLQVPTTLVDENFEKKLLQNAEVIVPYNRPLIIPMGLKSSTKSWGHCE